MKNKLLIIEDDNFLRDLLSQKLIKMGYEVVTAPDGEEGLVKMKEEKPDLALLDLILPGIGGFEFLAKAKEDTVLSKIPIIILSNLGQKEEIDKGLQLGAVDFLIKAEFSPGEIADKIKKILGE